MWNQVEQNLLQYDGYVTFLFDSNSALARAAPVCMKDYPDELMVFLTLLQFYPTSMRPEADFSRISRRLSCCLWRRRLLDHPDDGRRFLDAADKRRSQHWSRRAGNRVRHGEAVFANCFRAHFAISHAPAEKLPSGCWRWLRRISGPAPRLLQCGGSEATETSIKLARQFHQSLPDSRTAE